MNKNILIIGGGGYIGCELVNYLLNKNYKVSVLDIFFYGEEVFKKIKSNRNLKIIKGDIRNRNIVKKSFLDITDVIHLACISNDPSALLNPDLTKDINQNGFKIILEEARLANIDKFIFASSSSVYGISNEPNVYETHPRVPLSLYNISKAWCEDYLINNFKDLNYTIIRPATVCRLSNRQRLDLSVNMLTAQAIINKKITVFGGEQYRPNLNIKDMIRLYEFLLETNSNNIRHEIFNASYKNLKIIEIAEGIAKNINQEIKIDFQNSDDKRSYRVNSSKLKSIGFDYNFKIEDAIADLNNAFINKILNKNIDLNIYHNVKLMLNLNVK